MNAWNEYRTFYVLVYQLCYEVGHTRAKITHTHICLFIFGNLFAINVAASKLK